MKITKIMNNDDLIDTTGAVASAILLLINSKINNRNLIIDDNIIIDQFLYGFIDNIDYDKYITIANNFIKNKLSNYKHNLENTMELNIPIQ